MIRAVSHLVDDASFGGVNRMLDHMQNCLNLNRRFQHRIVRVKRGRLAPPAIEADVVVSHLSINWANLPMLTALRAIHPDTPLVHVEHSYSQRFVASKVTSKQRFDTLLRTSFSLFDVVVAVSEAQFRWMERRQFCPTDKLVAIPSCVDLAPYFAVQPKSPTGRITIGAIGRMDVQKGFDILIDGFIKARRESLELALFGDGPEIGRLRDLAGNHQRIAFHGYMPDTSAAVAMCDAIAMPSRWEPYGLVAVEAMAAGRAVMCPRVDGLADHIAAGAIEIGDNGVEDWARFLAAVDRRTIDDAGRAGRDAVAHAGERFSASWTELLRRVCEAETDTAKAA